MCECCQQSSAAFFDTLAGTWDSMHDLAALAAQLDAGLETFGVKPGETVLDAGCGTGNLTAALLRRLSGGGKVVAVDISGRMIEHARAKTNDGRVSWVCGAVEGLDPVSWRFDRVICFSVWPHLEEPAAAARLFRELLRPGGKLHIWHVISRESVNRIHSQASGTVNGHLLAPANETAALLKQAGFIVEETRDDEAGYLVTARKPGKDR